MKLDPLIKKVGEHTRFLRKRAETVTASKLGNPVRFPYGPFQFKTSVATGVPFEIRASTDLKTWIRISDGVTNSATLEHVDSDASKFSHRFYRVLTADIPSTNVVGYAAITLPPGFSMIANPLDGPNNTVGELFKGWPDGTRLSKFDTRLFRLAENEIQGDKWKNSGEQLAPGEGAIFFNPTADYKSHSFVGEVLHGNLSIPIPAGFSMRSSLVPQPGQLKEDLQFPIGDGDVIHLFDRDRQKYVLHDYEEGKWKSGSPVISVGESFWVAKTSPANWVRNFGIGV